MVEYLEIEEMRALLAAPDAHTPVGRRDRALLLAMLKTGARVQEMILEDRHGTRSTIMTSQIPPEQWHDHLGDATVAGAILDRILHNALRTVIEGPSRRKEEAAAKEPATSSAPFTILRSGRSR